MKPTFSYDPQKSARNQQKHGIDFQAAQTLWLNRVVEVQANVVDNEMRYANIGRIGNDYWTAIISYHGASRRIISVYPSNTRQIEFYERSQKPNG